MKSLSFYENVKGNFAIFENFRKFYRILRETLGKNLKNIGNMHLYWLRGRSLPKQANLLKP